MQLNQTQTPIQNSDKQAYLAPNATQRAAQYGYLSPVREAIFFSIDGIKRNSPILESIYNRFTIFDYGVDEMGEAQIGGSLVYAFGNSILNRYCATTFQIPEDQPYIRCGRVGEHKVSLKAYQSANETLSSNAPTHIFWPAKGAVVPPFVAHESDSKLTSSVITGYPITLSLNPSAQKLPTKVNLKLYRKGKRLKNVNFINQHNDPNHILKEGEFALIPNDRLKFHATYTIKATLTYKDQTKTLTSHFKTSGPNYPIFKAGTTKRLKKPTTFALYLPPTKTFDGSNTIHYQNNKYLSNVKMSWYDPNTIIVKYKSADGGKLTLQDQYHKTFTLLIQADKKSAKTDINLRPKIGQRFHLAKGFDIKQTQTGLIIYTPYKLLFDQDTLKAPYELRFDFDYPHTLKYKEEYMRNNIDYVSIKTNGDFTRLSIRLKKKQSYTIKPIGKGYEVTIK
jgi:hypothetical protein